MQLKINETFYPALESKCRVNDLWGGRGRGGSRALVQIALIKMLTQKYFRGIFIRQVFNDVRSSLFQDFMDVIIDLKIENQFKIDKNSLIIYHPETKNKIISRGLKAEAGRTKQSSSLTGITDIFIDEADELELDDYMQLSVSLRTDKADNHIFRAFNPPNKRHWIWSDYVLIESEINGYFKAIPKQIPDLLSIFSTYLDNIDNINTNAVSSYERFKEINPEYYFTMICGLISEGKRGRIYKNWKPLTDKDFNELPYKSRYVIDFGYSNDPNALIEVKAHGNEIYVRELLYLTGLDDTAIHNQFVALGLTKSDEIIFDYGGGGNVRAANLSNLGWNMLKCFKPQRKKVGINALQHRQVFATENSTNLWTEYGEYSWQLDRDKVPTDEPIDKSDHLLDCILYFETTREYL